MNVTRAERFQALVQEERLRQDGKWGTDMPDLPVMAAVLGEETGEVCRAVLEHREASWEPERQRWLSNLEEELIQVAAVCQRIFEGLSRK